MTDASNPAVLEALRTAAARTRALTTPAENPDPEAPQSAPEALKNPEPFKVPESAAAEYEPSRLPVALRPCPAGPDPR